MGDGGDSDLEKKTRSLFKPIKRFFSRFRAPIGVGLGFGAVYYSYLVFAEGRTEIDTEKLKEIFSDWMFWLKIPAYAALCVAAGVGVSAGIFALRNHIRKKKGKKPLKIGEFLRIVRHEKEIPKEERLLQILDAIPDSSIVHKSFGSFYFKEGRIVEALEAYYKSVSLRDEEFYPKVPVVGTTGYFNAVRDSIETLEQRLAKEPASDGVLLELAMSYFLLNDFDRAVEYFEKVDRKKDQLSFSILASKFYEEVAVRLGSPKVRRFSFGESRAGKLADKAFYFWDKQKQEKRELRIRSRCEAMRAVKELLNLPGLEESFDSFGGYSVYTAKLGGLVDGFVVLKRGDREALSKEAEISEQFGAEVSGGKFKSVRPITIAEYRDHYYLVMFYEAGKPLAESTDKKIFEKAVEFVARSDALMPLDKLGSTTFFGKDVFLTRVYGTGRFPTNVADIIYKNCDFLFAHEGKFAKVFDGDWRADMNVLYDEAGNIIALDKQDKGATIGPVNAARVLYQGTREEIAKDDDFVEHAVKEHYAAVYNELVGRDAGRKIDAEYFFPVTMTSAIQKAITASCVFVSEPYRQRSVRTFLGNALHAGQRILSDRKLRQFYEGRHLEQCAVLERVILDDLWRLTAQ
ncbi:tetratricopeptide repeat protein [Candidatus Woesearchaeota archaeon]|nr:tetratricopeptide repeat protein [Candidatus Woesearchaeota archaeon]